MHEWRRLEDGAADLDVVGRQDVVGREIDVRLDRAGRRNGRRGAAVGERPGDVGGRPGTNLRGRDDEGLVVQRQVRTRHGRRHFGLAGVGRLRCGFRRHAFVVAGRRIIARRREHAQRHRGGFVRRQKEIGTLGIGTLRIRTLRIGTFGIRTLRIGTFGIGALRVRAFRIRGLRIEVHDVDDDVVLRLVDRLTCRRIHREHHVAARHDQLVLRVLPGLLQDGAELVRRRRVAAVVDAPVDVRDRAVLNFARGNRGVQHAGTFRIGTLRIGTFGIGTLGIRTFRIRILVGVAFRIGTLRIGTLGIGTLRIGTFRIGTLGIRIAHVELPARGSGLMAEELRVEHRRVVDFRGRDLRKHGIIIRIENRRIGAIRIEKNRSAQAVRRRHPLDILFWRSDRAGQGPPCRAIRWA